MKICIGLCSSRFDLEFKKSIKGLKQIIIPKNVFVNVIVIDNNYSKEKKNYINKIKSNRKFKLTYRVESKKGIVHARNNFLKYTYNSNKKIDYAGFIDDDCIPKSNWLIEHLKTFKKFNCDISTGPQILKNHKNVSFLKKYQILNRYINYNYSKVKWAATNNVLFKFHIVKKYGIRFDIFLNDIGGSDQLFFSKLHLKGLKIMWNKKAIVREVAKPSRYFGIWFRMRSLRYGYSGAYMDSHLHGKMIGNTKSFFKLCLFITFSILNFIIFFNKKNLYLSDYYLNKTLGVIFYFFGKKIKKYY